MAAQKPRAPRRYWIDTIIALARFARAEPSATARPAFIDPPCI